MILSQQDLSLEYLGEDDMEKWNLSMNERGGKLLD